nr:MULTISPECIES: hypothetical protein [unclassified Corynebacterium]
MCVATLLVACSPEQQLGPLGEARKVNQSRHVSAMFEQHPVVLADRTGLASLQYFFRASETLVVSDPSVEAQLRAASIAVVAHAPMLVYDPNRHNEILQETERLHTYTVLTVGDVPLAQTTGRMRVYRDPGGRGALGPMTSLMFEERLISSPESAAQEVAKLRSREPTWLRAAWADPAVMKGAQARPFPILSRRDADMAPLVVATANTSIAAIANARSFGAKVVFVDEPDPRASFETLFALAGLADGPLVALGTDFGTSDELSRRISQAEEKYQANRRTTGN